MIRDRGRVFFLICIISFLFVGCQHDDPYPHGGMDSIDDFADGRYHIMTFKSVDGVHNVWSLDDFEEDDSIDDIIYIYVKEDGSIYTLGSKGYTKLDLATNEVIQSTELTDFCDKDIIIFDSLEDSMYKFIKRHKLVSPANGECFYKE